MQKKMLLAAVGDYDGKAPTLFAPAKELDLWSSLLTSRYGFPAVPLLKDGSATKSAILAGLENLLKGAADDDQLVFVFLGHGTRLGEQQALVAHPGRGTLKAAAITSAELQDVFDKYPPRPGTDVTLILDACFAKGIIGADTMPLFVEIDDARAPVVSGEREVWRFIDLAGASRGETDLSSGVVVVTASAENQAAYELKLGPRSTPRLLFSYRAIDRLKKHQDTFLELIANINPLRFGFPQNAYAEGSDQRLAEEFPGEPGSQLRPARAERAFDGGIAEPSDREGAASDVTTGCPEAAKDTKTLDAHTSIRIRILGNGCFIEPRPGENRIVLPRDCFGSGEMYHFGFLEIAVDDIVGSDGNVHRDEYLKAGVLYRRWLLTEHSMWISNADQSMQFEQTDLFKRHVPDMPNVCPEITGPREACYDPTPDPQLFSGFIDLISGTADIGPLESVKTRFYREQNHVPTPWGPEYTPLSVVIEQPFTGNQAIVLINNLDGSSHAEIYVKPGATILAGSARERDITGDGGGDIDAAIFKNYYRLADAPPLNPPLPVKELTVINACSVIKWP